MQNLQSTHFVIASKCASICVAIHNHKLPNNAFLRFLVIDCHESTISYKIADSRNDSKTTK
ncbi:hypothetical protein [Helicobacter sp. T3_23-1056]